MQHIIAGFILMILGSWLALNPKSVWKIAESWKQSGGEINGSYWKLCRFLGGVFLLVGLAVVIWG